MEESGALATSVKRTRPMGQNMMIDLRRNAVKARCMHRAPVKANYMGLYLRRGINKKEKLRRMVKCLSHRILIEIRNFLRQQDLRVSKHFAVQLT